MFLGQNKYIFRAVQRPHGHNEHINEIKRAQDAIKLEHEGVNRGDCVCSDRWINGF
jgi:hypothetical protein